MPSFVQPAAEVHLAVPFGIPVGQQNDGRPGGAGAKKTRVHQIVICPRRRDLAGKREHAARRKRRSAEDAEHSRWQASWQTILRYAPAFRPPRHSETRADRARRPCPPMCSSPHSNGIDTPVVIGGPPGMLVAPYFLFQPGHNSTNLEYRGVRKTCQTSAVTEVTHRCDWRA